MLRFSFLRFIFADFSYRTVSNNKEETQLNTLMDCGKRMKSPFLLSGILPLGRGSWAWPKAGRGGKVELLQPYGYNEKAVQWPRI
jgi:hypothetical protein